jgi:Negative regulator of sigma F
VGSGAVIGFAAGACAWVAVDLWCPIAYVRHLLLGHLLPVFLLALTGALLGRLLLPPR